MVSLHLSLRCPLCSSTGRKALPKERQFGPSSQVLPTCLSNLYSDISQDPRAFLIVPFLTNHCGGVELAKVSQVLVQCLPLQLMDSSHQVRSKADP